LVRGDIENYIDFRMRAAGYRGPKVFTREGISLIARASQGLTRRVNILADKALLAAFAGGTHAVTATEVRRAIRDSEFYRAGSGAQKIRIGAAALAAGLVLGWATHVLLTKDAGSPSSQASAVAAPPSGGHSDAKVAPVASAATPAPSSATSPAPAGNTPTAAALATTAQPSADAKPTPAATVDAPERKPVAPAQGELARERFESTQAWLRSTPGDRYAIQLATASVEELPQLEDFLRKATTMLPGGELFVYSVKIDGRQHYRVSYGSYPSAASALDAMKGLPQALAAYQPYTRSVERMRSQNRQ